MYTKKHNKDKWETKITLPAINADNVYTEGRINIEEYRAGKVFGDLANTFNFGPREKSGVVQVFGVFPLGKCQPDQKECECRVLQHDAPVRSSYLLRGKSSWQLHGLRQARQKPSKSSRQLLIAVGTTIAGCPPHGPGRALISASGSYLG